MMLKLFDTYKRSVCVSLGVCFLWFSFLTIHAQQKNRLKLVATISAIGRADSCKCSIRLRWAVNDPFVWKLANSYGYLIDRYTILREGQLTSVPVKVKLTSIPVKPFPLKEWEPICQTDDNAAILAQGIYGDDFEVSGNPSKLAKIVAQSNQLTQRFTFSLMAADRSFKAACMAGLGWVDTTVKAGEKYLYKIYSKIPRDKGICDTALVFIGTDERTLLPKPLDVYAVYGDKNILLSWDTKMLKSYYSSYLVERSSDDVNFVSLSPLPFSNLNDESKKEPERTFYVDTIQNNRHFSYRVKGITPFGEYGPPSDVVKGEGKAMLAFVPNIKDAQVLNDTTVLIAWEFSEEETTLIDHFELNRSVDNAETSFVRVIQYIEPTQRTVQFAPLLPSNYFTITAVDKNGNRRTSFSYLVQPVDSLPPAVPVNLTAKIDSTGTVTLRWKANSEPDLRGYVVLKGNLKEEEPAVVNSEPLTKNGYTEKVALNTLNGKVYYSVMALDRRMNQSKPCRPVEVIKPDRIPPAFPVLTDYKIDENNKIRLTWAASSSDDVVHYRLYRKAENDSAWIAADTITGRETTHCEITPPSTGGGTVLYTLRAVDGSDNLSEPSPTLTVTLKQKLLAGTVRNLRADPDPEAHGITVSWKTNSTDIAGYTLYKAVDKGKYTTLRQLPAMQQCYTDTDVSVNTAYRYALLPTLTNGKKGEWKEVKINY
jgi:uncharacterized protein